MAETTTQLTTIGLKEVLANLTKADAATYNDKIPISRNGKNLYVTPMMLKAWDNIENYDFHRFGDYTSFDELLAAILVDANDANDTLIGVGKVNGVGVSVRVYMLGVADKHYIIEVSGPLNYYVPKENKFKNSPIHPTLFCNTNSLAGVFVRNFHKEYQNGGAITEWEVEGGHYFIGNFAQAGDNSNNGSGAEKNALFPMLSGNSSISTMHYTCDGNTKSNGLIIQQVTETTTQQILFWDDKVYIRHIKFTDNTRTSIEGGDNDYKFVRLSSYIYDNWDKANASKNGLMSAKMYTALKQLATAANITID